MSVVDEYDLYNYFEVYEEYQKTEEPRIMVELDKRLSQLKDLFHKNSKTVINLLSEKKDDLIERYENSYKDLVFDLEMHANSMEEIKRTHTYDSERGMWIPT